MADSEGAAITVMAQEAVDARVIVEWQFAELFSNPDLLQPVFQPVLSLATGEVVGYEGFSRFAISPQRPPDAWFADASLVGLGSALQALAIRRILGRDREIGRPTGRFLSINVSPRFLAYSDVAAAIGLADPAGLVVELTEEEPVRDYVALRRAMAPYLKDGIRFAVDDAGAGFASMRHVIELAPAYVKLDAYLIRGIRSQRTLRAFLRAINSFTTEIGAILVAEGVESLSDLAILTETGFPLLAQGFAIGRPGDAWPAPSQASLRAWRGAEARRQ